MIRTISHLFTDFLALYKLQGLPRGDSTGFTSLDPFYTVRRGEFTLITGIPRHGKSSFLDNVIVNLADRGWKWLIFSPENHPVVRHAAQLAEIYIGRSFRPGIRARMSESDFVYASAFLDTQVQFLEPPAGLCNIESILDIASRMHIDGLVIDPWNRLLHKRTAGMSETEYIGQCLSQVGQFVRDRNVHVFIIAHPQKLLRVKSVANDGTEAQTYPIPTPYDISGSAHWLNMSDNCICVWRDLSEPREATQIHIQKIRFREIGNIGMCKLLYDPGNGQYIDPLTGPRPIFEEARYLEALEARIERQEETIAMMEEELGKHEQV